METPVNRSGTSALDEGSALSRRLRNVLVALGAIAIGAVFFFSMQSGSAAGSLEKQARAATPLEIATANGKPTLLEFYADWCTTCRAMAPELADVKAEFAGDLNFAMLNVDNTKWLPELLRYRVDGIPHFVYLDRSGEPVGMAIGEQPRSLLEENLQALVVGEALPSVRRGRTSELDTPGFEAPPAGNADPRSHGAQVRS
ncbi:thioredoxin family protein [Rubidibacter lacunae]|uniref:thioredoxin family protein n=1 Tax=Rubidibacter lacunae TaxID=582514 RepID=UPI00040D7DC9|nr:thioredoxin family protein [Rubidibacter lacunae]